MFPKSSIRDILNNNNPLILIFQKTIESDQIQMLDLCQSLDLSLEFDALMLVIQILQRIKSQYYSVSISS